MKHNFHRICKFRNSIYFSFADKDRAAAFSFINLFIAADFDIYYNITTAFHEQIEENIRNCACFVALITENYASSHTCMGFLSLAKTLGKSVIGIYADDTDSVCEGIIEFHILAYKNHDDFYNAIIHEEALSICNRFPSLLHGSPDGLQTFVERGFVFTGRCNEKGNLTGWGKQVYMNGNSYEGEFTDGKYNGFGIYISKGGAIYEGFWKDDKCEGYGIQTYVKEPWKGDFYEGNWSEDKMHGFGRYTKASGEYFEGRFVFGESTEGTYKYPDGRQYVGAFENDLAHGYGTFVYADGSKKSGIWTKGRIVELYNTDCELSNIYRVYYANGDVYTGGYDGEDRCGTGTIQYANGASYTGEWKENLRHGKGVFTDKNGNVYDGTWKNDGCTGKAVIKYIDGSVYDGEMKNGDRHGCGRMTFPDGTVQQGMWQDDVFLGEKGSETE